MLQECLWLPGFCIFWFEVACLVVFARTFRIHETRFGGLIAMVELICAYVSEFGRS